MSKRELYPCAERENATRVTARNCVYCRRPQAFCHQLGVGFKFCNSQKQPLCLRRFDTNKKTYKNEVKHLSHYNGTQDNRLLAIPHALRHLLANVGILRNHNELLDRLSLETDIPRHQVSI